MLSALANVKDEILGIVRHVLTTLGGAFVTAGYLTESELGIIVGSITTLIGIGLSIWDKMKRRGPQPVENLTKAEQ